VPRIAARCFCRYAMTRAARASPGRALSTLAPEVSRIPIPNRAPAPMNYPLIATGNANAGRPSFPGTGAPRHCDRRDTGSTRRQRAAFANARQRRAPVSPRAAALSLLAPAGPRSRDRRPGRRPESGEPSRRVRFVDQPSTPASPRSPTGAITFTTRSDAALGHGHASCHREYALSRPRTRVR